MTPTSGGVQPQLDLDRRTFDVTLPPHCAGACSTATSLAVLPMPLVILLMRRHSVCGRDPATENHHT